MVRAFKGLLTAAMKITLHLYSYIYGVVKPIPFIATLGFKESLKYPQTLSPPVKGWATISVHVQCLLFCGGVLQTVKDQTTCVQYIDN